MSRIKHINSTGKKALNLMLAVAAVCIFSLPAYAQERQHKIEAAYLYSFFNYITWPGYATPQDLRDPVICVYGEDEIMPYLEYVRSKMGVERNLSLRTITEQNEVNGCHILFMRHLISPHLLTSLPGDVLTVLQPDDPLDSGAMIELAQEEERITIKINQSHIEQNGFQVSSRLLNLAK